MPQTLNLNTPGLQHELVVCLVRRSGADRMDPKRPEPFELVAGWPDAREGLNKQPRMVSVLFTRPDQLEAALHHLADMWGAMFRRDPEVRGRVMVTVQ